MRKLYKVLAVDGSACHGGAGKWPLPEGGKPGAWLEIKGKIVPCKRGLHLYRAQDLVGWLGPAIFEAEHEGELIVHDGGLDSRVVARKARLIRRVETWNERTARLFAADCAERALPIFERAYPNDPRPRKAIDAARAYAHGEIDAAAARAAAWAAARDAARNAARNAAWEAAWAAAKAATWAAAWAAAGAAARAAAWDAAGDAVRDAAWAATWAAARDAERKWQTARLFQYLDGES